MSREKRYTRNDKIIMIFFVCMTVCSFFWKGMTGFDTDEQYAIVTASRFLNGDRYMIDLFDAYQFSGFFESVFWGLSGKLSGNYPIHVYRLISTFIFMLSGLPLWQFLRKKTSETMAFLEYLVWMTALPKSILSLEHAGLAKVLITYLLLAADSWMEGRKHPFLLGIVISLLALTYPTMVLLVVPVFLFMIICKQYKEAGIFTAVCFLTAAAVFLPVVMQLGFNGLMHSLHMIAMDASHTVTAAGKMASLQEDSSEFARYSLRMLEYGAAAGLGIKLHDLIRKKKTDIGTIVIAVSVLPFLHIIAKLATGRWTPLYLYDRYLLILLITLAASIVLKKKTGTLICILLVLIWTIGFATTNNGFYSPDGLILFCTLVFACVMYSENREKVLKYFLSAVLLSQCACMMLTARLTGTMANTVFDEYFRIWDDLPGLKVEPASADFFSFTEYCAPMMESDNLVVSGYDGYAYIISGKRTIAPVTMSTVVYGKQWKNYFAERLPQDLNLLSENDDFNTGDLLDILSEWYTEKAVTSRLGYTLYYLERK